MASKNTKEEYENALKERQAAYQATGSKARDYNDLVYRLPNGMTREQAAAQDYKNWIKAERDQSPAQYQLLSSTGKQNTGTYNAISGNTQQKSGLTGRQALDSIQMPGGYQSQYQRQLQGIMGQLQYRQPFVYDVNGDALYQQYKDQYMRGGKLAMQDTMGQAAALTGGYGNSYAASAGNQAYQAYLGKLNEAVPQLYSLALDKYNQETSDLRNLYNMYQTADQSDYGRWSDDWSRWMNAYQQAVSESQFDRRMAEDARQFDRRMAEDARQFDATLGLNYNKYYSSADASYNPYTGGSDLTQYPVNKDGTDDETKNETPAVEKITGTGKETPEKDTGFIQKTTTDLFGKPQGNLQKIKSAIPTRAQYEKSGKNPANYAGDVRRMIKNYVNSGAISAEEAATLYYYYGIA